jgi:hypothetical protein
MTSCGQNCVIFNNVQFVDEQGQNMPSPTLFIKSVNILCSNCGLTNISEDFHQFCYRCADHSTEEFAYHHARCRLMIPSPAGAACR